MSISVKNERLLGIFVTKTYGIAHESHVEKVMFTDLLEKFEDEYDFRTDVFETYFMYS